VRAGQLTFAVVLQVASVAGAAEPPADAAAIARKWLAHAGTKAPGISVAAFDRSGILWSGGFGFADLEQRRPATAATRYHFASITKVHTTLILAQLAVQGKVGLDDPVTKYLPGFKPRYPEPGAQPITLRHLATHTAGLTNWWRAPASSLTEKELVDWQRIAGLAVHPGFQFKYSNHGLSTLGAALAHATGKSYSDLLRERVLRPLGMKSSGLEELYDHADLARGYWVKDGKLVARPRSGPFRAHAPASALVSTVEDVARFGCAHLANGSNTVVPSKALDMLFTPYCSTDRYSAIGLGWHYTWRSSIPRWWHLGAWNYNYSRIVVRPDAGIGLALATNGPWGYDPTLSFLKLLTSHADTSAIDALTGEYADDRGKVVTVLRPPGPEMTLEIKGAGRLIPMTRRTFRIPAKRGLGGEWVRFIDEVGKKAMLWESRKFVKREDTPTPKQGPE